MILRRLTAQRHAGLGRFIPLLSAGIVFSGCAIRATVPRVRAAEVNLKGINRVAVLDIGGKDGENLGSAITQGLFDSKRFELVERSALERIYTEQGLSVHNAFKEGGVALGKLLPATALISGNVAEAGYDEKTSREQRTCSRTEGWGKNAKSVQYSCTRYTRTGKARYLADVRLLDTNSGRILATKALKAEDTKSTSATDADPDAIDGKALLDGCRKNVATSFLRMVVPYTVEETVVLTSDGDLPDIAKGNEYFKRNDYLKAIELYGKAVAGADSNGELSAKTIARAHYALGVALAVTGDYALALSQLDRAYSLYEESEWLDFATTVKEWKKEADKVAEQGSAGPQAGGSL